MKVNIFVLIVILLLVLVWTFHESFPTKEGENIYIAFIGPTSGDGAAAGKTMTQAIELYLAEINSQKEQLNGKTVKLITFDDENDCKSGGKAEKEARRIVEENQVVAVIGHWYSGCSITGGKIYKNSGIPAITPGSVNVKVTQGNEWYFRNIYNASASGQFLAYYVKKVFRLNQVTIIDDGSEYGSYLAEEFEKKALDLEMEVTNRWKFQSKDENNKEINNKKTFQSFVDKLEQDGNTAGAIMLAVQASEGVGLVKLIKEAGIKNPIISGSGFSERTFTEGFKDFPREKAAPGYYTNDIYVATPLIFDTANERAQEFKESYQAQYGTASENAQGSKELDKDHDQEGQEKLDWSAAYAYDTAMVLIEAIKRANIEGTPSSIKTDRLKIRDQLADFTNIHDAVEGTTGFNYFDDNRDAQKPVAIGVYKSNNIVSALTQFQVIRNLNEIANLDQAIQQERVLTIGDRYMYKTNVVYTGIKINEISDFQPDNLTFTLDFHIWFRSAKNFEPQDIEFLNALEPDKIKEVLKNTPINEKTTDQITYRVYRIKSRFRADYLSRHYAYKQHILSVNFHHKSLTRNNLIYVTDVLGMGDSNQVSETQRNRQIISPTLGWFTGQIRFFPDVVKKYSLGDPEYLNVQAGKVEYSRFNASVPLKKNEMTLRGVIPDSVAQPLIVLSGLLIFLLNMVSKKFRKLSKWIWFFQASLAFIFLLSAEVVLIDLLSKNLETYQMKFVIQIFDILWWVIPAFLLNLASESFIWTPVEEKTGRLIPNIVRLFLAFIIYFMAFVGIIAFVYDEQLTSILATSGVIAMIIGLAIQINISNIFSGIAINIESPFRIGDWVQIGKFEEGQIVDITWRTTRLKTRAECILSIPNSMASESPILNFCYPDDIYWLWPTVYVHPMHPPARVKKLLLDALLSANKVLKEPAPVVLFTGINEWASSYWVAFCADDYADKNFILEEVWTRVWFHLNRAGITPAVQRQEIHMFKGVKERGGEEATKPITLLQEVVIFKQFDSSAKQFLSERIRRHRFGPNDIIVQQGDAGDSLFVIVEGVVCVQVHTDDGKTQEVARLGAGDFFGEMALLTGEERTATVIALVDTSVFELTKADIAPLIAQQPEVSELVSKVLSQRQMATQSRMHIEEDVEEENKAAYIRILNKIEHFFGLREEQ